MSIVTLGSLNELDGMRHAFFTRQGGVSTGIYNSLNCGLGSRDAPEAVQENRRRAAAMLDFPDAPVATLYQVHGTAVVELDAPLAPDARPLADAFVSKTPGVILGILTADCAPVLFYDPQARVVGAAHAGWKGALGGVLEATLDAMAKLGADRTRIVAAIGPCIAQRSYEVGAEFPAPFLARSENAARFFAPARAAGTFLFDLRGYAADRLAQAGLASVDVAPNDTCAESDRFFSYRRSCHNGEPDYGRGLSAIVLEP
jgi:YfiH family protein